MSELDIQPALVAELLVDFLREEVGSAGMQRALLGVSGGIDSAVAAALSARAFGPEWAGRLRVIAARRALWRRSGRPLAELARLTDAMIDARGWLPEDRNVERARAS